MYFHFFRAWLACTANALFNRSLKKILDVYEALVPIEFREWNEGDILRLLDIAGQGNSNPNLLGVFRRFAGSNECLRLVATYKGKVVCFVTAISQGDDLLMVQLKADQAWTAGTIERRMIRYIRRSLRQLGKKSVLMHVSEWDTEMQIFFRDKLRLLACAVIRGCRDDLLDRSFSLYTFAPEWPKDLKRDEIWIIDQNEKHKRIFAPYPKT